MSSDSQIPPGALERRKGPEKFRARDITVVLTADDIQASLAWYRDVMAFHVDERFEEESELRSVTLLAGKVRILVRRDDGAGEGDRRKGEGISILLTTEEDIDEFAREVKERGGELEAEPTDAPGSARLFRIRDPDGFELAISSEGDWTRRPSESA